MSQSGASTTVSSTKKIGEGSLVLTVTYWPQIEQVVKKQQDLLCAQGNSDAPPWFTDADFKEILKTISGQLTYDICLSVNKADGFCMYLENSDHDPMPVVTLSVQEGTGIEPTPNDISIILQILDNHWSGTCYVRRVT